MSAHRNTLTALVFVLACEESATEPQSPKQPAHEEGASHVDEPAHEALPKRVRLDAEVIESAAIRTAPVTREVLAGHGGAARRDRGRSRSHRARCVAGGRSPRARQFQGRERRQEGRRARGHSRARPRQAPLPARRRARQSQGARAPTPTGSKALARSGSRPSRPTWTPSPPPRRSSSRRARPQQQLAALGLGAAQGRPLPAHAARAHRGHGGRRATPWSVSPSRPSRRSASIVDLSEVWFLGARLREGPGPPRAGRERRGAAQRLSRTSASPARSSTSARRSIRSRAPSPRAFACRTRRRCCASVCSAPRAWPPTSEHAQRPARWWCRAARSPRSPASPSCSCATPTTTSSCTRSSLGESAAGKVQVLSGPARGRAGRGRGRVHAQERRAEEHLRRGRVGMALLSAIVAWSLRNRPVVLVATLLFALFGVRAATHACRSTRCPTSPTSRCRSSPRRPRSRRSRSSSTSPCPSSARWRASRKTTEVRSISKYGISVVTIVFEDGTDIYFARQLVNERMREARGRRPVAATASPRSGPITSGPRRDLSVHGAQRAADADAARGAARLADRPAAPHRARASSRSTASAARTGSTRSCSIPKRLQAAGVSVAQVVEALEKSNANAGGGYIEHNREHFVIGTRRPGQEPRRPASASSSARRRRACRSRSRRSATCSSARACAAAPPRRTARARSWSAWR